MSKWLDRLSGMLLAVVMLYILLPAHIGYIEGLFFPVTSKASVVEVIEYDEKEGWTYFSLEAEKHRNCVDWERTEWFYGSRNLGKVSVPFDHLTEPTLRKTGKQFWEINRVRMKPQDLMENSVADVYHYCKGWRWWYTETAFFG